MHEEIKKHLKNMGITIVLVYVVKILYLLYNIIVK